MSDLSRTGAARRIQHRESEPELPVRFGRYVLVERLGAGGMADVYRAIAPGAAGVSKAVCIKRIQRGRLEDPRLVSLFIDEARVSMQLSHVNIVHTYDFGRVGDEYFLALEFVEGVDLSRMVDRRLTPEEVAVIGESLCRALAHVHARRKTDGSPLGLLHRDVTPRNILVTPEGDVKLTDFGVARLRSGREEGLRGTLAYMAPEQAAGEPIDSRADLFALGLVLYECLHGRPAYQGGSQELLELARRGEVAIDPSEGPVARVVARALAPRPADRYQDGNAMAEDLGRIVAQARAAGGSDPRVLLGGRVADLMSPAGPLPGQSPGADARPATYYTLDGSSPDFAARLGATQLSQAGTLAGTSIDTARPGRRWRLGVGLALLVAGASAVAVFPRSSSSPSPRRPSHEREAVVAPVEPRRTTQAPAPPATPLPPARQDVTPPAVPMGPPIRRGTLDLNALPWADVTIDGVARGTTPLTGLRLSAGRHRLTLRNGPLGVTRTVSLSLHPEEHRSLVVNLRETPGTGVAPTEGGP